MQAAVPCAGVGQGVQRAPHEARASLGSQRLEQRCVLAGQVKSQSALTHTAVAPSGGTHGAQRAPHDAGEVSDAQVSPQRCVPVGQGAMQRPDSQRAGEAHAWAQAPQLPLSLERSVHPTRGHHDCGAEHAQRPALHHEPAPHEVPQVPQWLGSARVSTQRPSHCAGRLAGHWHAPPRQRRPEPAAPQGVSLSSSSHRHTRSPGSQRSRAVHSSSSAQSASPPHARRGRHPRVASQAEPMAQSALDGVCSQRPSRHASTVHDTVSAHSRSLRHDGPASRASRATTSSVGGASSTVRSTAASREEPTTEVVPPQEAVAQHTSTHAQKWRSIGDPAEDRTVSHRAGIVPENAPHPGPTPGRGPRASGAPEGPDTRPRGAIGPPAPAATEAPQHGGGHGADRAARPA